mmetsp:Transcript_70122/g.186843  ORF Transcript_70122/g.186843 Transcript_70122/m.186843 type:complete len:137 (-) Transcript_70122:57-467(-)
MMRVQDSALLQTAQFQQFREPVLMVNARTSMLSLFDNNDNWPFPDMFRPSNFAQFRQDDPNVVLKSANCPVNTWKDPKDYKPNGAYYMTWKHYGLPPNGHCSSLPDGYKLPETTFKAKSWDYKCYSNGKCSIFESE